MPSIVYAYGENIYINLTNACPCACVFCVRQKSAGLGSASSLWLEKTPSFEEVKSALGKWNLADFRQLVFCGYGEPTCALDILLQTCAHLRKISDVPIRLNTNGLSDLINEKPTAKLFAGMVDSVSISLNASNAQEYNELCKPRFGADAFPAILRFARDCKAYIPYVRLTAVDKIPPQSIAACREIAEELGLPFRLRHEN
ncbi:MAG: TIGR04100 family radical SAM protein [Oscillospiraceae bacterium]|nr:TIGR04100 family radical SAM protein [Oscillospiraceae bacterium]